MLDTGTPTGHPRSAAPEGGAAAERPRSVSVLITGFGPFPGAPFNPTGPLVQRLACLRRPGLCDTVRVAHVFPTSYVAVDRDLPRLLAQHRPDVLLMFGLAGRTRHLRIETRARNRVSRLLPDAAGRFTDMQCIVAGGPAARVLSHAHRLLQTARQTGLTARLSHDAGRYVCNYLCWRALEQGSHPTGPRVVAFVHVPKIRRAPTRPGRRRVFDMNDLLRAGEVLLRTSVNLARRG